MLVTSDRHPAPFLELLDDVADQNADAHRGAEQRTSANRRRQSGFSLRTSHQCRHMPIIDNENVTNTLIEYITTSVVTCPPVNHSAASAAKPISITPLCVASRSERLREPVRHPGVAGHVGQHARAIDKAGLRGDEQQAAFGDDRDQHEAVAQPVGQAQLLDEHLGQHGVHRLVADFGP